MALIHIFKLGNLEKGIVPDQKLFNKFKRLLDHWDGKFDLTLVWGPDIEVITVQVDKAKDFVVATKSNDDTDEENTE